MIRLPLWEMVQGDAEFDTKALGGLHLVCSMCLVWSDKKKTRNDVAIGTLKIPIMGDFV